MKRQLRRSIILLVISMLALGCMVISASAAKKIPVKKLKNLDYKASCARIKKNATTVKTGTCRVQVGKKKSGYVKFKAPKTKDYTFTLSGVKTTNKYGYSTDFANIKYIKRYSFSKKEYLYDYQVRTQGGKAFTLWFGTKKSVSNYNTNLSTRASRYGKIKLNKGETVYLYFYFSYAGDSCQLNIK